MTNYDKIIKFDIDEMVMFLFAFADETLSLFANFQLPDKDRIREFLEREIKAQEG